MFEEQLKEIGLTDNEAKIYILLLKEGQMNPAEISQKLGLHRGYVYDALERMQEKQVVNFIFQKNKKFFQATKPLNLLELLKLKFESFQKIIPELNSTLNTDKEDTRIETHKGKTVYRTLLKDILSSIDKNDEILLIGIDEDILTKEVEPIYLEQYLNTIKSMKIKERIIIKKGRKKFKSKFLHYKQINEDFIGETYQIIYKNKVAIFILGNPYYLILIENKKVSENYRKQFNFLWKIAK